MLHLPHLTNFEGKVLPTVLCLAKKHPETGMFETFLEISDLLTYII